MLLGTVETDQVIEYAKGNHEAMPESIYKQTFNTIYRRYVYIRNVIAGERCQQPMVAELITELTSENIKRITKTLGYSTTELWFYVHFTQDYNPAVR